MSKEKDALEVHYLSERGIFIAPPAPERSPEPIVITRWRDRPVSHRANFTTPVMGILGIF